MKSKYKIVALILILAVLFSASFAAAQGDLGLVRCAAGNNNCQISDLILTVIRFINFAIGMSWLVAVFFVFWGAYGLATSYGNSEKIEGSKKTIQQAVVGFFLIMVAFLLMNWLVMVLGGYSLKDMVQFLPILT